MIDSKFSNGWFIMVNQKSEGCLRAKYIDGFDKGRL